MNINVDSSGLCIESAKAADKRLECLAEIAYWDEKGVKQTTNVSEEAGWTISFKGSDTYNFWNLSHAGTGLKFTATAVVSNEELIFSISRDSIKEHKSCLFQSITPLPFLIAGKEGDGSQLVIPYEEGALCHCHGKAESEYEMSLYNKLPSYGNMSVYGIDTGGGSAVAAIINDGRFDCSLRIRTNWGKDKIYSITPVFALREYIDEDIMPEGIKIHIYQLQGESSGFVEIGKCYRRFNRKYRKLPDLAQKIKDNPALEYSCRAISLRCRLGVKPVPTQILEQTPENQPPVNVMMSFDDVGMLVEECAKQQLGPTEFNLVGWNYGGHDGAFPQLFPVEEALGGEDKLKELIKLTQGYNYPLTLHDCYFDAYSLADKFDIEKINRNYDGTPSLGGEYGGGQAYQVCAKHAYGYAMDNIPEVVEKFDIKGAYYTDVLSVAQLTKCYHPDHAISYGENAYWWKKILGLVHDEFGVSYSEGARDWALPELDRAYLIGLTPDSALPFIDEKIPLYQIAYHGFLIYNSFRGGINLFPGNEIYLRNIAYGGMPTIYFHHIFNPEWTADDGWDEDLTFEGPKKLKQDVARIKQITEDVEKYSWLQTEFIEDYIQHSKTLTETVYSNGYRIVVNYADELYKMPDGTVVPPENFIVNNKASE